MPDHSRPSPDEPANRPPTGGGKPPFGKPPFGKPKFGKPPFGKPAYGKPPRGPGAKFSKRPGSDGPPPPGAPFPPGGDHRPVRPQPRGDGPAPRFGPRPGPPFGDRPAGPGAPRPGKPWLKPAFASGFKPRTFAGPPRGPRGVGPMAPAESLARAGVRFVFEDVDVIVVEKPSGLLSASPGNTEPFNLFRLLKRYTQAVGGPGARRGRSAERDLRAAAEILGPEGAPDGPSALGRDSLGLIHRLDREASGLMVFSKTSRAFHWLKDDFKTKKSHRLYTVLVHGVVGEVNASGTIQSLLKEFPDGRVASIPAEQFRGTIGAALPGEEEPARPATTHYRILAVGNGMSLLQVRLDTGRKHQIRVHLSERGHPVAGDRRYGAPADPIKRLALHASELGFRHPGTGQSMRYIADAPAPFYLAVGATPPPPRAAAAPAPGAPPAQGNFITRAPGSTTAAPGTKPAGGSDTSWEAVAGWYDELISEKRNDHYDNVIIPGTLRLVQPAPGQRLLDVACGQGVMSRALAGVAEGVSVVGVDAAPSLVAAAERRAAEAGRTGSADAGSRPVFIAGDARELVGPGLDPASFDGAVCVMGLGNIDPLAPMMRRVAELLRPGGAFTWVITHPAFRAPGQTGWGWDTAKGRQFRRVDGYLSAGQKAIQMHPGAAPDVTTWTFHRPLQHYFHAMAEAGLLVAALEEWAAVRTSQPGPRAAEENRIRAEIPLFMAVRAVKPA